MESLDVYIAVKDEDLLPNGKSLFESKLAQEVLQIKAGCFIQNPFVLLPENTHIHNALLLNQALKKFSLPIALAYNQYFATYRTALDLSAANGVLFLGGSVEKTWSITDKIKASLPNHLSNLVEPISVIIEKHKSHTPSDLTRYPVNSNSLVAADKYRTTLAQKPIVALFEMMKAQNKDKGSEKGIRSLLLANALMEYHGLDLVKEQAHSMVKDHSPIFALMRQLRSVIEDNTTPQNQKLISTQASVIENLDNSFIADDDDKFYIKWQKLNLARLTFLKNDNSNGLWLLKDQRINPMFHIQSASPNMPLFVRQHMPEKLMAEVNNGEIKTTSNIQLLNMLKNKPKWLSNLSCEQAKVSEFGLSTDTHCEPIKSSEELYLDINLNGLTRFNKNASMIFNDEQKDRNQPSLGGFQVKSTIRLAMADGKRFIDEGSDKGPTHIVKFPHVTYDKAHLCTAEFFGMKVSAFAGVKTADVRLAQFDPDAWSDNISLLKKARVNQKEKNFDTAILIERFDICKEGEQSRKMLVEIHSLTGENNKLTDKNGNLHTVELVAKTIKKHSTNWNEDKKQLFKAALVNTIVGNHDSHLKNWGMLYEERPDGSASFRLSPSYDICAVRSLPDYCQSSGPCQIGGQFNPSQEEILSFAKHSCDLNDSEALALQREVHLGVLEFESQYHNPKSKLRVALDKNEYSCQKMIYPLLYSRLIIASQTGQIKNLTLEQTYSYLFNQTLLPDCLSDFGSPPEALKTVLNHNEEINDIFHSDFFDGILSALGDEQPKHSL